MMNKKLACMCFVVMTLLLSLSALARADSQETVECTPEDGDIKSSEAYELAKQALLDRFDLDVADLPWETHFVSYSGFFGYVDEEPIWLVSFGREDERPNAHLGRAVRQGHCRSEAYDHRGAGRQDRDRRELRSPHSVQGFC